jgi:hypothetical protein
MDRILADRGFLTSQGRKGSLLPIQRNDSKARPLTALPCILGIKASAYNSFQPLCSRANESSLSNARISGQEQSHPSLPVVSARHRWFEKMRMDLY